jgi:glycosyltransferase involved in cell wall biosynthesis
MKILLVARWPVGGIKTYFRYIYGSSQFDGAEITLLAPPEDLENFIATQLPNGRIKLVSTKTDYFSFVSALYSCLSQNNYDVVHSHGFSASLFAHSLLFFKKTPHVITAHDVFLKNTFSGRMGTIKHYIMQWMLGNVTKVLSVSEDARQNILEYFPRLNPTQVFNITNGVDTQFFKQGTARDLRQELDVSKDSALIGFFGRFMAQKGFHQIIKAIEILHTNQLLKSKPLVLTFGWGGFIREDFALIEEKGLSEYFVQLPGTNDMPAAIKGVDLVVMPSRWEACPLLPMEVLSTGTPMIGTNCIGLREVLAGTPAKVIPVGDASALAHAITEMLDIGKEPFLAYQDVAVSRYSAEAHSKILYDFYMDLIMEKNND